MSSTPVPTAGRVQRVQGAAARRLLEMYHRWTCTVAPVPDEPALVVNNHGFGALTDINVIAAFAALETLGSGRHVLLFPRRGPRRRHGPPRP